MSSGLCPISQLQIDSKTDGLRFHKNLFYQFNKKYFIYLPCCVLPCIRSLLIHPIIHLITSHLLYATYSQCLIIYSITLHLLCPFTMHLIIYPITLHLLCPFTMHLIIYPITLHLLCQFTMHLIIYPITLHLLCQFTMPLIIYSIVYIYFAHSQCPL